MKAIYKPTNEIVEIEGVSESGVFTRVSFNGSTQFVATGQLVPMPEEIPRPVPAAAPVPAQKTPRPPDEVSLFLREMETEDDLRGLCKDIGIEYPNRTSPGLTKMAIGNKLRHLIKKGEFELSWS